MYELDSARRFDSSSSVSLALDPTFKRKTMMIEDELNEMSFQSISSIKKENKPSSNRDNKVSNINRY